jgi:hypothetical protein
MDRVPTRFRGPFEVACSSRKAGVRWSVIASPLIRVAAKTFREVGRGSSLVSPI